MPVTKPRCMRSMRGSTSCLSMRRAPAPACGGADPMPNGGSSRPISQRALPSSGVSSLRHARLSGPGGRLVYVTCSILPEENIDQVDWFTGEAADFVVVAFAERWRATLGEEPPASADGRDDTLLLSPARHQTDGFFIATFERRSMSGSQSHNPTVREIGRSSGRVLGICEYGDPQGFPVLAFHGIPGTRLMFRPTNEIARRLGTADHCAGPAGLRLFDASAGADPAGLAAGCRCHPQRLRD